jgi:diguanylate cyclase (GGDEF)-like protein
MSDSSWLIPDDGDRERMLDLSRRLQPARRYAFGVLAVTLVVCGPWLGWWTLAPLALAALGFRIAEPHTEGSERPEYWIFAAWAGTEIAIAVAVGISGGPTTPTMAWFAIPVVTLSARFSLRGVLMGLGFTLALMITVGLLTAADPILHDPTLLIAPVALVAAVAMLSTALMRSDLEHRNEAVIDPLTGMLNRNALASRVAELAQQSELSGEPVGLILADLDHFKQVNDSLGHAIGDAVLKDVAYVLRKELRAFDLAYRLGGEEFLVVLPGATLEESVAVAERLRGAVEALDVAGEVGAPIPITASVGAARWEGCAERLDALIGRADAALYAAKEAGRNRVVLA